MCRSQSFYQVLGLKPEASHQEIAAAYRRLAVQLHPDKNLVNKEWAESEFKLVNEAYTTLRDPHLRQTYDLRCGVSLSPNRAASPFSATAAACDDLFRHLSSSSGCGAKPSPLRTKSYVGAHPDNEDLTRVRNGASVVLHSLTSDRERNGLLGNVTGWDSARGRYTVGLEDGGSLSVRPCNLTQRCRVEIVGFAKAPGLNGQAGEIEAFDAEKGQYRVTLEESGLSFGLDPESCLLESGTAVQLRGLSQPELNGLLGRIVVVDRESARYTVLCADGRQVKVKYSRVIC